MAILLSNRPFVCLFVCSSVVCVRFLFALSLIRVLTNLTLGGLEALYLTTDLFCEKVTMKVCSLSTRLLETLP